jgi:hypothetical protein
MAEDRTRKVLGEGGLMSQHPVAKYGLSLQDAYPEELAPKPAPKPSARTRINLRVPTELLEHTRAAIWEVGRQEGYANLTDMIVQLLEHEVERLEAEYNSGEHFQSR